MHGHVPALIAALAAAAAMAPSAGAQEGSGDGEGADTPPAAGVRDANGHPFRTPAGSPLEPVHRIALVRGELAGERRSLALADLGDRLGFWIRRASGSRWELAGAVHGGVFSRFSLEGPDNDFIEVHYRVGGLLRARLGRLAARAELYHVSSHLGDELLVRTGRQPISTSREGVELLLQGAPVRGLVVYGGPGVLLRTSQGFDPWSLRWGAEWVSPGASGVRAYASAGFFAWSELDWDPGVSLEAGAALGRRTRLGFILGVGPSRAEQFFEEDESLFGLSVSYVR